MNKPLRFLLRRVLLAATLLVGHHAQAQVANDDCTAAVAVPITTGGCLTPVNGSVAGATQSVADVTCAGTATTALDVWYSFVANGTSQEITLAPRFAAVLEVRSGSCAATTRLFCASLPANNTGSRPVTGLTSGQTYFIRIYPNVATPPTGVNATFALCVEPGATTPPANDDCAGAIVLTPATNCNNPVSGTLALATQSLPPTTNCSSATSANDVWYSFVANGTSQNLTLTAAFSAIVDLRLGTCANATSLVCGLVTPGQTLNLTGLVNGQVYFLRLYTASGLGTTNPAFTLCLTNGPATPANDDCATAQTLPVTTDCLVPTGGSVAGATQSLAPTTACGFGTNPVANDVWYSFVATGASQILTATANFAAVVDVRTGTCASSSSLLCAAVGSQPLVPTGLTAGQTYFVRVYSTSTTIPTVANSAFTLCLNAGPGPSINDECSTAVAVAVVTGCATSTNGTVANATQSLPAGTCGTGTGTGVAADVWYSFVATGPTQLVTLTTRFPAVFEIRSGTCASSSPVFCGTVSALADAFVANGLATGQPYFIRIYANGQTPPAVTNATFTLCLSPAPTPPANDECAAAVLLPVTATCAAPVSGTVLAASQSLPIPSAGCGVGLAQDVWYRFVATATNQLITLTASATFAIDVRSGTCINSASVDCGLVGTTIPTRLVTGLTVGQSYFIRVYGGNYTQPAAGANFTLCVTTPPTSPPANDECTGAIPLAINAACVPTTGNVTAATQSLPASAMCGGGSGTVGDVWYSFVAASTGQEITLSSALTNFIMEVRSGTCATSSSLVCGTTLQLLQATGLAVGQTYYIRVYAPAFLPVPTGSAAIFSLCLTGAPANDEPCGAVALPLTATGIPLQPISSTTAGATTSAQPIGLPTGCTSTTGVRDVWFSFTPGAGVTSVRLAFSGTGASVLRLFTATNCAAGPLTQVGCRLNSLSNVVLTGLQPGQLYYLAVSDNGANTVPGPFTIAGAVVTAARTQADTEALVVFPNPSTTGQLTLRLSGPTTAGQVMLLNALGQAVLRQSLPKGSTEQSISTRALATGVYTLRVVIGEAVLTRKVVVE